MSALAIEDLSASYGAADVISGISLVAEAGKVTAVLGPNGAGKSTLVNAVSGQVWVTRGSVRIDDTVITNRPLHAVVKAGVVQAPQGHAMFGYSTCLENLRLGAHTRKDRAAIQADIDEFLEVWPIAKRVLHKRANLCSGGEQQVIAIGRALMSRPKAIMLDEPSIGLAPILVDQLFSSFADQIRTVEWSRSMAVLLVEQNVGKALSIADDVIVLVGGAIVARGPASDFTPQRVAELYLHGHSDSTRRSA